MALIGCWRPRRDGARHTGSLPISSLFTFVECRGTASQSGGPTNGEGRATRTEARRGGAGTSCSGERAGGRLENERTLMQRIEPLVYIGPANLAQDWARFWWIKIFPPALGLVSSERPV